MWNSENGEFFLFRNYHVIHGRIYLDVMNVPKGQHTRMVVYDVPQIAKMRLQGFDRRAIKVAEGLQCDFGQHFGSNSVVVEELRWKLR